MNDYDYNSIEKETGETREDIEEARWQRAVAWVKKVVYGNDNQNQEAPLLLAQDLQKNKSSCEVCPQGVLIHTSTRTKTKEGVTYEEYAFQRGKQ